MSSKVNFKVLISWLSKNIVKCLGFVNHRYQLLLVIFYLAVKNNDYWGVTSFHHSLFNLLSFFHFKHHCHYSIVNLKGFHNLTWLDDRKGCAWNTLSVCSKIKAGLDEVVAISHVIWHCWFSLCLPLCVFFWSWRLEKNN